MEIDIAHINQRTEALGPGLRYVLWTQGCNLHCNGCLAPEYRTIGAGEKKDIEELTNDILGMSDITGVTISGGEPFLQSESLIALIKHLKLKKSSLNYIIYTGFEFDHLLSVDHQKLVHEVDLLIAGPYIDELNDDKGMAGSKNQTFHYITDRLLEYKNQIQNGQRKLEIKISDTQFEFTGVPERKMLVELNQIIKNYER